MLRDLSPIQLAGSLYIPATHKNVDAICLNNKYPELRSCIIDTEDAIAPHELSRGLEQIQQMLKGYVPQRLALFIRPRNPHVLKQLLQMKNIDKVDGFSLPKFSTQSMHSYEEILKDTPFYVMPVLESQDIFEIQKLQQIRDFLRTSALKVLTLRIGGEDMMNFLGLKRRCERSIYTLNAPAYVIGSIISTFKPYGYSISASVFNCIHQPELYENNVREDLEQGLIGKTIIHPNQIAPINTLYQVTSDELSIAQKMLDEQTEAITLHKGQMGEKFAHFNWAKNIIERHRFFGLSTE